MQIEAPPDDIKIPPDLRNWLFKLWMKLLDDHLIGSVIHDFGSIPDGDEGAKEVTVGGARLGDHAIASLSVDILDGVLDAQVTASNTVTCVLANNTGGALVVPECTIYVRVFKNIS